jgi:hypothetical protein
MLTRDNLVKVINVANVTCLFCSEKETVHHLFFDCFVARIVSAISDLIGVNVDADFESVARWCLSSNNNSVINVVCTANLWSLWKLRNDLCFQGKVWPGVQEIWRRVAVKLDQWENSFQGCSGSYFVREGDVAEQEMARVAEDSMELKVIIHRTEDLIDISSKDFAESRAETCRKLILKFSGV